LSFELRGFADEKLSLTLNMEHRLSPFLGYG
jgi:hypothetical protein